MHSTFWHYYRGKIRNYQRGSQYPPGKEKKKYDGSRKWTKRQIKCWLNLRLLKAKVRMKVKSEEESKRKKENGFSEAARGYFNCNLYFLRNILLLLFVQLQMFYIQSSIFSFMNETDDMVLPYSVQIKLLQYLQYLIRTSGKIV